MSNQFNGTNGTTACPAPFLDPRNFPKNGGYINGRFCGNSTILNATCCLPCPIEQWVYPDSFITSLHAVDKVSILSLISCIFLLLSWLILPSEQSHRHYLSVGLTFSVLLVSLAFVIPLSTQQPQMCYNAITPADMFSSPSCGWSGALFQAGGLASGIWVLLRVLWLHLRICWGITPGRGFTIGSLFAGLVIPAIFLGITIAVSGFSYQLGAVCFLNHEHSFVVFWGWLIAFAILAFIIQLSTSGYALLIYLQVHKYQRSPGAPPGGGFGPLGSGTPRSRSSISPKNRYSGYSFPKGEWRQTLSRSMGLAHRAGSSPRTLPAPNSGGVGVHFNEVDLERTQLSQKWAGISKIFAAQWRLILLCLLMVVESIYFATTFWAAQVKITNVSQESQALSDFGTCLMLNRGNKTACMDYTGPLIMGKGVVLGTMAIAALMGFDVFLLLSRSSMYLAWWSLLRHPKFFLADRWSAYNPKPYELSDNNRGSRPSSTFQNNDGKDKLAIPAALSALTTEARLRADGSMRSMTPLQDLEAALNAQSQRGLPPIPQSPQSLQEGKPMRYSTYLATRASEVPMPPSPISQIAPPAYPQTPMAGHTYTSGHQHPEILRIRSPPPRRPPRPWSIQREPMQTTRISPPPSPTTPRAPEPGFETQKLRAGGIGSPRAAAVRSPSQAPDPAAAFRDALRLNPVTGFVLPGKQRETGERKLSGGEASISPLVPRSSDAATDYERFSIGEGSEETQEEAQLSHTLSAPGGREGGSSSSVEKGQLKGDGMRRRSKDSSPIEQEFEESPVDPDRRPSAASHPQHLQVPPMSHPVQQDGAHGSEGEGEPPPTPGIGRAY